MKSITCSLVVTTIILLLYVEETTGACSRQCINGCTRNGDGRCDGRCAPFRKFKFDLARKTCVARCHHYRDHCLVCNYLRPLICSKCKPGYRLIKRNKKSWRCIRRYKSNIPLRTIKSTVQPTAHQQATEPIVETTNKILTTQPVVETTNEILTTQPFGRVFDPKLSHSQQITDGVQAVTSSGNRLFVIPNFMNQISVYDATTFQLVYTISVPDASDTLYGLALSPTNNYLYVSDRGANKVFRVDLSSVPSTNLQAESWSVASVPNGLSVNSQLNVLVATDSRKIQEYTPNGTLVREVTLNAQLYQAVEVNSGTWAVSRKSPNNNVCLMSINGTVLYCTATGLLKKPASIAVDSQGYVLVADSGNNRIVVLSPTLSDARTLPLPIDPPDQINYPLGLWLDEARCRLYVGESFDTNRLLVYDNVCNLGDAFSP